MPPELRATWRLPGHPGVAGTVQEVLVHVRIAVGGLLPLLHLLLRRDGNVAPACPWGCLVRQRALPLEGLWSWCIDLLVPGWRAPYQNEPRDGVESDDGQDPAGRDHAQKVRPWLAVFNVRTSVRSCARYERWTGISRRSQCVISALVKQGQDKTSTSTRACGA
jgi:hypothetical protein